LKTCNTSFSKTKYRPKTSINDGKYHQQRCLYGKKNQNASTFCIFCVKNFLGI